MVGVVGSNPIPPTNENQEIRQQSLVVYVEKIVKNSSIPRERKKVGTNPAHKYAIRLMNVNDAVVGTRVRSLCEFAGVPLGTKWVIDEGYDTGVMVAWDTLVQRYIHKHIASARRMTKNSGT